MSVERVDTVVIGAGQAGLGMSYCLTQLGREHVVLDQAPLIASAWRGRWDSFTLVSPAWMIRLPGATYRGPDADAFLTRSEIVALLESYASSFSPPLRLGTRVLSLDPSDGGGPSRYRVTTDGPTYAAANVVVAAGPFQTPRVPSLASGLPRDILQLTPEQYRNPGALPLGGVLVVGTCAISPTISPDRVVGADAARRSPASCLVTSERDLRRVQEHPPALQL